MAVCVIFKPTIMVFETICQYLVTPIMHCFLHVWLDISIQLPTLCGLLGILMSLFMVHVWTV